MCEESALGWRSALALRLHRFNKLCHSEPSGDTQRRRCARNLLLGGAALQRCDFIASTSFVIRAIWRRAAAKMCEESAFGWRSASALRFDCFNKLCYSEPSGDAQRRRCARNLLLGGAAL